MAPSRPIDGPAPTTAQIRDAIDSGRTGEKVKAFDPAAAPLGTDEEAAGTPPSHTERRLTAEAELRGTRPEPGRETNPRGGRAHVWLGLAAGVVAAVVLGLLLYGALA